MTETGSFFACSHIPPPLFFVAALFPAVHGLIICMDGAPEPWRNILIRMRYTYGKIFFLAPFS